jgi:HIRAN domain
VPVAGVTFRPGNVEDASFDPGRRVALVPEPDNEHDPDAIGIWDVERRLQAGYVPADATARVPVDAQALSLWEFRDEEGRRVGLRVLIAPAAAWIGRPRA